jgi:hypothetical protein
MTDRLLIEGAKLGSTLEASSLLCHGPGGTWPTSDTELKQMLLPLVTERGLTLLGTRDESVSPSLLQLLQQLNCELKGHCKRTGPTPDAACPALAGRFSG